MKDCKCGRRIPSDWKICGECNEKRNRAFMYQGMEGTQRREFVAERAKVSQALARKRPHTVVTAEVEAPKASNRQAALAAHMLAVEKSTDKRLSTPDAIAIDRLLERKRIVATQKLRRKLEHKSGTQAIKDWYLRDD